MSQSHTATTTSPSDTQRHILARMLAGEPLAFVESSDDVRYGPTLSGQPLKRGTFTALVRHGWVTTRGHVGQVTAYALTAAGQAVAGKRQ